ncbi:MAG TPA: serine/threonine-protein kinase [Polyangiaceae bacterium]|nr:serine/threonine-protein kinase [Polyangiaceae bacterium]
MVAPKLIDLNYDGPQRIDRYDLVAEIASGGMATVFLANLSGVGGFRRFVAIKRLHPHLAREQEFVEMFLDEARLAAGIHHPHVVPILEVGASERGYYLVMEYIEGDTLARLLARAATSGNRLPMAIGTRIVVEMLSGLHAAHELRDEQGNPTELVHRDVSPQNILVGIDGTTRITDFGVARAASRLSATRAGQLKGKIAYMAPEQAMGDPAVDRRADVFSAGIVLWEVLAARRLFKAENEAATLARVISEPIPDIREVNPRVDPDVAAIVMTALQRDRDARYPTCQDFGDDLEAAAQAAGALATPREVSAYVTSVIGQEIAQQREAVRAWLARSEPSQGLAPDMTDSGHASLPPSRSSAPMMGVSGEKSGMVPTQREQPAAAAFDEPSPFASRRSKTPVVIAVAAVIGFAIVGLLALAFGSGGHAGETPTTHPTPTAEQKPASPPPPAATATAQPQPAASTAAVTPPAGQPTSAAPASGPGRVSGHASAPRATRRSSSAEAPAAPAAPTASPPPVAPAPTTVAPPPPKPADDIDLSSPYR